jgi:hypothetical protein
MKFQPITAARDIRCTLCDHVIPKGTACLDVIAGKRPTLCTACIEALYLWVQDVAAPQQRERGGVAIQRPKSWQG